MRTERGTYISVIALFLAALWTPLIGMLFGAGQFNSVEENRTPAPFVLGRAFTAYFHDHFGYRVPLITAQALLKVRVFGVSSSPEVVLGKNGWLFYAGEKSIDSYRGVLPFAKGELDGWAQFFNKREEWLAKRGIPMVVAVVPDKPSVYPEFMPSWIRKAGGRTRLDEFMTAMRGHPNVRVLDLRGALLDAKPRGPVYYATDTHWTPADAYAGYVEIVREIASKYPDIRPVPFSQTFNDNKYNPADLVRMLGLASVWRDMPEPDQRPAPVTTETAGGDLRIEGSGKSNRRLVMFGDSFSYALIPYLARHFEQMVASRSPEMDPARMASEHPDIVLFEMVERKLNGPAPRSVAFASAPVGPGGFRRPTEGSPANTAQ